MKHKRPDGQPDTLTYSNEISKIKSHQERMLYLSDLDEKFHDLIMDIHLEYIEAGAEVITTTNFSSSCLLYTSPSPRDLST